MSTRADFPTLLRPREQKLPYLPDLEINFREKCFNFRFRGRIQIADVSIHSASSVERVQSSPLILEYQMTLKSFSKSEGFRDFDPLYLSLIDMKI